MSTCTWADVTARLDDARAALDSADFQVALGRLVDTVRRWHDAQDVGIAAGLHADTGARRAALCAEERVQRVDELVSTIWSMTASGSATAQMVRSALDELAAV